MSARRFAPGAISAWLAVATLVLLLVAAAFQGRAAKGSGSGGGWLAALQLAPSPGCPAPLCPSCASKLARVGKQQQQQKEDECPPPPDCPAAEPAQCPKCADPPAAAAGAAQAAAGQGGKGTALLCDVSDNIYPAGDVVRTVTQQRSVVDSLDRATSVIEAGVRAAFAQWEHTGFTLEDVLHTADVLSAVGTHDTQMWVEVHNGTVTFPRRHLGACKWFCNEWIAPLKEAWERGMRLGKLRVPKGLPFLWNVYDHPACRIPPGGKSSCTGPVFSIIKHQSSPDVLAPPFGRHYEPVFVPWAEKSDLAFFRGKPWCAPHGLNGTSPASTSNCSRESLSILSDQHPDQLNVSLLLPHGRAPARAGPPATHGEHGQFKYLLQLDGITSSRRFATLLSINSLVFKQASNYLEWFYHALHPCEHYLPFWVDSEDDVLPLLRTLRGNPANEATAQRIAANANAFAAAWLDEDGQLRYWQLLIDRYAQLYRGSTNPATLKRKRQVESLGQQASKAGEVAEEACHQRGNGQCWAVGRDAAVKAFADLQAEAYKQEQAAVGGKPPGGAAGGAADEPRQGAAKADRSAVPKGAAGAGSDAEGVARRVMRAFEEAEEAVED